MVRQRGRRRAPSSPMHAWTIGAAFLLAVAGCQTPNVQPFHDATTQLHAAVHQVYGSTVSRLAGYDAVDREGHALSPAATNHPMRRFTVAWETRLAVMDALLDYSESLANVVASGEESKANARVLSDRAAALVEATPWGVYGEAAKDILQQVHALAVSVAQYAAIDKAVGRADQAVQRSAEALDKDFQSLAVILLALHEDHLALIGDKYNHHRSYVNEVTSRKRELEDRLLNLRQKADGPRLKLLEARAALAAESSEDQRRPAQAKVDALSQQLADAEASLDLVVSALKQCDELLKRVADTEAAYQSELKTARDLGQASLALTRSTRQGIRAWARAHRDLQAALEANRQPNIAMLVASARQIEEIIRKVKSYE